MVRILESGEYIQELKNLILDIPEIESFVKARTKWFRKNPNDTRLDNHPLKRKMVGKWAFSISDDIRIVYKWTNQTTARFLAIGLHIIVYRKARLRKQSPKR